MHFFFCLYTTQVIVLIIYLFFYLLVFKSVAPKKIFLTRNILGWGGGEFALHYVSPSSPVELSNNGIPVINSDDKEKRKTTQKMEMLKRT